MRVRPNRGSVACGSTAYGLSGAVGIHACPPDPGRAGDVFGITCKAASFSCGSLYALLDRLRRRTSGFGPSRHIAAPRDLGRIRGEADIRAVPFDDARQIKMKKSSFQDVPAPQWFPLRPPVDATSGNKQPSPTRSGGKPDIQKSTRWANRPHFEMKEGRQLIGTFKRRS
jgi:hypothetical protein